LYIVVSGDERWAIKSVPVLKDIYGFTRDMLKNSGAVGSQTLVQNLMVVTQGMHGNDPKWYGFPDNDRETLAFFHFLATSGDPGDTDRFIDYHDQFTNIAIFYKDKTGPTIKKALTTAKEYMEKKSKLGEKVKYQLAGGVIGVEAAINEVVAEKQLQTLIIALLGVFMFCAINFRSFKIGMILMIPLAISNFMAFAYMAINQIGLSISTLPVSAAGIGMGVDYGIYLIARLSEEKRMNASMTLDQALLRTIQTYGKSIIDIAGTLVLGLLVWILSPLKFQAQMGLMLAVILFLNCLGAVFLVPVMVLLFKPKFHTRA
jgi:predicted RND superfamily exporter protein